MTQALTKIKDSKYFEQNGKMFCDTKEGPMQISNFTAEILDEQVFHDGQKITTILKIRGKLHQGDEIEQRELPLITVPAADFASCGWVADKWGMAPIIFPVSNATADLKTAIQLRSTPRRQDIYTHTGWTKIDGKKTYLTTAGGIQADQFDAGITVQLPDELKKFSLPPAESSATHFGNFLRLINLGPKHVTWPLLLGTVRAAIGAADFALHLAGRTGTYKSEVASLFQSAYGVDMDARHLPASWNSTANALEALAYRAKNALIVVDDFVPQGTPYQVRTLQAKADSFIRAQGNQAGRARLTDASSMQQTYFPRGIILSTGEDIPEGHSVRARMVIVELAPGDIDANKLTECQNNRPSYAKFMASFIHWLCKNDMVETQKHLAKEFRDAYIGIGHSRTPSIMGELIATAHILKDYAQANNLFNDAILTEMTVKAERAIVAAGNMQIEYLHDADPSTTFCESIRQMLITSAGHFRTTNGGIPHSPTAYGWQTDNAMHQHETWTAKGAKLGWIDTSSNEMYFDPAAMGIIRKTANGKLAVTPQTLAKRLKEAGVLVRTDTTRERNTVRMTLEGHPRNVLVLDLAQVMGDITG